MEVLYLSPAVFCVPAESGLHVWDRRGSYHGGGHGCSGCGHQICGNAQRTSGKITCYSLTLLVHLSPLTFSYWSISNMCVPPQACYAASAIGYLTGR